MWSITKFSEGLAWNNCDLGCAAPCHPNPSMCWRCGSFKHRQIDMLSMSSLYNAENADATALLAESRTQRLGGIQEKHHLGRGEQKREQKDGSWATVLFSEGKDTCVCTEQVGSWFANSSFSGFFSNSTVRAQLHVHRCKFTEKGCREAQKEMSVPKKPKL